ncbi:helix-turn-helix domain-containing protein [Solihabitans fulvus]|uniref:Helix-turn-helix domain-containing protein n=1 Tax=Solihabitans fulvus TaxID=1892852 RepID=A0A5B2X6P6_9PSEU|nr:helix-turn-helix transcriptional regulator [Solihabitans fulvus]KAA2258769.1 helix-turn-helix domain-containing protein [Solihabitans fulvus]
MTRGTSPTLRKRRLVSELRRLREEANLTIEEVGEKLECSASKISRIETGRVGVSPRDVRDMLDAYGASGPLLDELVQLAREARRKAWWDEYGDVVPGRYVGFEADAESLRTYQGLMIPGLLQDEAYTRALISEVLPHVTDAEIERRVQARRARQALLVEEDPLMLHAVIDEAALRRLVGGRKTMLAQLNRLLDVRELANVTVSVVPFSVGGHAAMDGPFVLITFPDQLDSDLVYLESARNGVYLEQPSEVQAYAEMFERLFGSALGPEDSAALIAQVVRDLS